MAETFIALGSALAGAASSAGAAATSLFGGGAAATAGAATGASTLSSVLSVGSALASIGQGFAANAAAKSAAAESAVQESQIKAQGAQRKASLAREYEEMVADQTAIAVASGLNPNVGTPATVKAATTKIAEENLSVERANVSSRFRAQRAQTRSLLSEGRMSLVKGFFGASTTMLDQAQLTG